MVSLPAGLSSYRLKVQQIQPISPNQFFIVKTKGTFQSHRSFGLSYNWCCTSAALICHQARGCDNWAITAPPFVLPSEPTGRRGGSDWNLHTNAATSHLGTCHQSGRAAHAVKPPLICYHDTHGRWPETGLLFKSTGWMRWCSLSM